MPTFLVTYSRTVAVRHAVEQSLEVEVEADTESDARRIVRSRIDDGDTEGHWVDGEDRITGGDDVDGSLSFVSTVPSERGRPPAEREASYMGWLKLSADTPDRLRRVDVDRVLSAVPEALREDFKTWLLPQVSMHAVREAITAWVP